MKNIRRFLLYYLFTLQIDSNNENNTVLIILELRKTRLVSIKIKIN